MRTRTLIGALVVLFLLLVLFPAGLGAPELVGMLLIAIALVSVWRWRRHKPKEVAA
jgi:hypothetical membrane protein